MKKAGFVSILGRPSSGKSTLLNALCGHKVAIVSSVPQTTRNKIRGIVTEERGQLVFVDTPGYHDSTRKFNLRMTDLVTSALKETEVALYVIDSSRAPGEEEARIASFLSHAPVPVVAAVNKTDLAAANIPRARAFIQQELPSADVVDISAATGAGLDALRTSLFERAPEGEAMYPEEFYTDQPPEFRVAEIIREKAIEVTSREVPHSIYVEVAEMEVRKKSSGSVLWIRAFILVERESQKGIVVGAGGSRIRTIRIGAQEQIESLFPYDSIYLDLRVKVDPNWRSNDTVLRKLSGS